MNSLEVINSKMVSSTLTILFCILAVRKQESTCLRFKGLAWKSARITSTMSHVGPNIITWTIMATREVEKCSFQLSCHPCNKNFYFCRKREQILERRDSYHHSKFRKLLRELIGHYVFFKEFGFRVRLLSLEPQLCYLGVVLVSCVTFLSLFFPLYN